MRNYHPAPSREFGIRNYEFGIFRSDRTRINVSSRPRGRRPRAERSMEKPEYRARTVSAHVGDEAGLDPPAVKVTEATKVAEDDAVVESEEFEAN